MRQRGREAVGAARLDGKALARRLEAALAKDVADLVAAGTTPRLDVVLVGDDPASQVYVRHKGEACARVGIKTRTHRKPPTISEQELLVLIEELNEDARVHGILVQLPLPAHIDKQRILKAIDPAKDVDAFHPESVGHALIGNEAMAPCTAHGVLLLLDDAGITLSGAEVVIVNHSDLIGKPLAALLINRDATVTVCHKRTRDLAAHTRRADILVSATGVPGLITKGHVRPGAVVVDVGISRLADGTLKGDVADGVWDVASYVTPVPGGVGPMTIAVLLANTVRGARKAHRP